MLSQIFDPSIKFQIVPVFQQAIISVHHCSSGNTIKGHTFTAPIDIASCEYWGVSRSSAIKTFFLYELTLNINDWFKSLIKFACM